MNKIGKFAGIVVIGLSSCLAAYASQQQPLTAENFLNVTRFRAALQDSFAILSGRVSHLRRNAGGAVHYPIEFIIRFSEGKVDSKLTLNRQEVHRFKRNAMKADKMLPPPENSLLQKLGFEVNDLALGFLDYPLHGELEPETRKTVHCRVLLVKSPAGGVVKVWISSQYYFPLRAEFYGDEDLKKRPLRTLEITGFKKVDQYYVATDIALMSDDFRTRIAFDECTVAESRDPRAAKLLNDSKETK